MLSYWKHTKALSVLAMFGLTLSACSTTAPLVRQGDRVEMSFTCRLAGGELAATTRPDASVAGEAKAPVYLPRTGPDAIAVTAGAQPPESGQQDRLPFEMEIVRRLAPMLTGLSEGDKAQWLLEAERFPVASPEEKLVRIATVRKRQKEMRLTGDEYATQTGKSPELGQPFVLDKMVPGRVSELTGKEVVIRFTPVQAKELLVTPFGPITVRELADHYELEIAAEKGRLIRTGAMAGRIVGVDRRSITIDYGHPFADEKLNCEVKVLKVEPRQPGDVATPVSARTPQAAASPASPAAAGELDPKVARQLDEALRKMNAGKVAKPGADAGNRAGALREEL